MLFIIILILKINLSFIQTHPRLIIEHGHILGFSPKCSEIAPQLLVAKVGFIFVLRFIVFFLLIFVPTLI
ncbi:MAG TPA: hypothetical protein DDX40_07510 [Rikenellaceae bacterium]|nr:hypothetical protein [Rikenellaceae bacterium]